jgi:hypothetical protein
MGASKEPKKPAIAGVEKTPRLGKYKAFRGMKAVIAKVVCAGASGWSIVRRKRHYP